MAGTKERIMEATAELFRRQGYTGTGLKQITAAAGAPFGSLYHYFPGGKEQLSEAVIRASGEIYFSLFEAIMSASPDVATGVANCFSGAAGVLRQTGYADACPIETIALEVASTNETLRIATADVFESWIGGMTRNFSAAGIAPKVARDLAIVVIAGLEGAFVLSRAMRTTEAIESAGASASAAVRAATPRQA